MDGTFINTYIDSLAAVHREFFIFLTNGRPFDFCCFACLFYNDKLLFYKVTWDRVAVLIIHNIF